MASPKAAISAANMVVDAQRAQSYDKSDDQHREIRECTDHASHGHIRTSKYPSINSAVYV